MTNITIANFTNGSRSSRTSALYQYDYGQILKFEGLELPSACEVHFSNTEIVGTSKTAIATDSEVTIPDEYLTSGEPVYVWIFLHTGETDGETEYKITIPVRKRPEPTNEEPTPQQQSEIGQLITALNSAVTTTSENAQSALQSALNANEYAIRAQASAEETSSLKTDVLAYTERAETAGQKAEEYATAAHTSEVNAETYAQSAKTSEVNAQTAQVSAETSRGKAEDAKTIAENARVDAVQARNDAIAAKESAQASARAAEASVGAGGYIRADIVDEQLVFNLINIETISFGIDDERLVVLYG